MSNQSVENDFDDELITDYRENFDDHYEIIINCIAVLEVTPDNIASIDELFRSLHTIKGNARMLMLDNLSKFLHGLEECISALRDKKIQYTDLLGESITLSLDKAKEISEAIFSQSIINDPSIEVIQNIFLDLKKCSQHEVDILCAEIIKEITGFDIDFTKICNQSEIDSILTEIEKSNEQNSQPEKFQFKTEMAQEMLYYISEDTPDTLKEHLGYIRYLALLLETKFPHWQGRTYQTLQLAIAFNKSLNNPVPRHQIEMAVYTHDMAFTFLPDQLVLKEKKFSEDETKLMQTHTQMAADFIGLNDGWKVAHEIVLQHHENFDGTGYPYGLKENEICIGAKMLSIIDAFVDMTTCRPDRAYKRSVLTALNEIKKQAGKQFSAELVPKFINILIKQIK